MKLVIPIEQCREEYDRALANLMHLFSAGFPATPDNLSEVWMRTYRCQLLFGQWFEPEQIVFRSEDDYMLFLLKWT